MIKNERQYRISKAQAAKFQEALETLKHSPPRGLHPVLLKAQREAAESQLADLPAEVGEMARARSSSPRKSA